MENAEYKKFGEDRREYRKYTPWIFFGMEMILAMEIFYIADFFVSIGKFFIIGFLAFFYYRSRKLFQVLDRQEKSKQN